MRLIVAFLALSGAVRLWWLMRNPFDLKSLSTTDGVYPKLQTSQIDVFNSQ